MESVVIHLPHTQLTHFISCSFIWSYQYWRPYLHITVIISVALFLPFIYLEPRWITEAKNATSLFIHHHEDLPRGDILNIFSDSVK
jgi:hypothetical protein